MEVKDYPVFGKIKHRRNVLLLGDSVDDIKMIEGFEYDEIIKIGFLNEKVEENRDEYLKNFDIVIANDSDMSHVNGKNGQYYNGSEYDVIGNYHFFFLSFDFSFK